MTGATGFLGQYTVAAARKRWRVAGTFHRTRREDAERLLAGVDSGRIDLTDFRDVREMLDAVRPKAVIHTAALADPNYCEQHPDESLRVNVQATLNLAGLCSDREIPFVFTSTDLVFDGSRAPYAEDAPLSPLNLYGEHKALAEQAVLDRYAEAVICRMPLLFGFSANGRVPFFQRMVGEFQSGRPMTLFADELRTPVSGAVAAAGLLLVAGSGLDESVNPKEIERVRGLLHLGGRESISRYEMGLQMLDLLGLPPELAQPISFRDVPAVAARAANVSLDSSRAYALGFDPPPIRNQIERILRRTAEEKTATDEHR
ncbi:MAG: NAD(P)-dependent oxidoreductase [Chloroflexi bacterium]|nr:NAD(P)-dependent oxidoreductase [Chloroflexota bacterium]